MLFLGGGALGVALASRLAPHSILAQFVGLFSFSLPFAISLQLWLGAAIVLEVWRAMSRRDQAASRRARAAPPRGSFVFVPTCAALVTCAGLMIGVLGSTLGVLATLGVYVALGLAYGVACWLFAGAGYLPFPQE